MTKTLIDNIDKKLWSKFAGLAKIKGMKVGKLLNEVIFVFLEKEKIIKKKGSN